MEIKITDSLEETLAEITQEIMSQGVTLLDVKQKILSQGVTLLDMKTAMDSSAALLSDFFNRWDNWTYRFLRVTIHEFVKTRELISSGILDIFDYIKVYGGGGGGGLITGIATVATVASALVSFGLPNIATMVGALTGGPLMINEGHSYLQKEALKIPRDQRTELEQLRIDTGSEQEYLYIAQKRGLMPPIRTVAGADDPYLPMTDEELAEAWKQRQDPVNISPLLTLSKMIRLAMFGPGFDEIVSSIVNHLSPPVNTSSQDTAPQEQTKSAALTYDSVTGLNVMTENGVVTGLSFDPGGPLAEALRRERSSWELLNRMAGEMPSVSNVTLPESSSAAVLPQAAVALVLGAEPPRDPHKVPPQYAYKTHAEAFADLDSAAAGNAYRPVFHSSSDGRGLNPDAIRDLAVSAVRRSFGGGRNLQITFAIDHVTVMAEQSEVNDRINMDRLMEKVEEALAEKLMEAMARGAV